MLFRLAEQQTPPDEPDVRVVETVRNGTHRFGTSDIVAVVEVMRC